MSGSRDYIAICKEGDIKFPVSFSSTFRAKSRGNIQSARDALNRMYGTHRSRYMAILDVVREDSPVLKQYLHKAGE